MCNPHTVVPEDVLPSSTCCNAPKPALLQIDVNCRTIALTEPETHIEKSISRMAEKGLSPKEFHMKLATLLPLSGTGLQDCWVGFSPPQKFAERYTFHPTQAKQSTAHQTWLDMSINPSTNVATHETMLGAQAGWCPMGGVPSLLHAGAAASGPFETPGQAWAKLDTNTQHHRAPGVPSTTLCCAGEDITTGCTHVVGTTLVSFCAVSLRTCSGQGILTAGNPEPPEAVAMPVPEQVKQPHSVHPFSGSVILAWP